MRKANGSRVVDKGLVVLAAATLIGVAAIPAAAAASSRSTDSRSSSATRSGGGAVSRSGGDMRATSSGSTSPSRSGASVTRSGGNRSGGTAHRGSSRPPRRHHGDRYYYRHRNYWGAYFGFYPFGYYGYHSSLYYPIFPSLYYGPHPYGPYYGEYRDYRLGALDLNVKPKKTEVWVDGQLVGRSGKFDGFPGYLWLDRGRHQLIFYNPGFATEVREVRVLQGAVVRLNVRLEQGESVTPDKLAKTDLGRRPRRPRRPAAEPRGEAAPVEEREVRTEPGRLLLSIAPGDASVYLDGRFLGTGEELSRLHAGLVVNAGLHTLEVVRPGFDSERTEVVIEADTETSISVDLESG